MLKYGHFSCNILHINTHIYIYLYIATELKIHWFIKNNVNNENVMRFWENIWNEKKPKNVNVAKIGLIFMQYLSCPSNIFFYVNAHINITSILRNALVTDPSLVSNIYILHA